MRLNKRVLFSNLALTLVSVCLNVILHDAARDPHSSKPTYTNQTCFVGPGIGRYLVFASVSRIINALAGVCQLQLPNQGKEMPYRTSSIGGGSSAGIRTRELARPKPNLRLLELVSSQI